MSAAATLDFLPHLTRLNRYARSLTRDPTRADDLVQDTILRALKKAHLFVQNTNLRGWLVTIMHNEHINTARQHFRGPMMVPEDELARVGCAETQTAPIELQEIRRAVGRLPQEQRQALLLHCVHGLKYHEVAAKLGLPIGTVQSRISRARVSLRAMIEMPNSGLGLANREAGERASPRGRVTNFGARA
jgi:RNA polymerase sigma-70 factor (ECF subfamily)